MENFDLIIIGGGAGAFAVAYNNVYQRHKIL